MHTCINQSLQAFSRTHKILDRYKQFIKKLTWVRQCPRIIVVWPCFWFRELRKDNVAGRNLANIQGVPLHKNLLSRALLDRKEREIARAISEFPASVMPVLP